MAKRKKSKSKTEASKEIEILTDIIERIARIEVKLEEIHSKVSSMYDRTIVKSIPLPVIPVIENIEELSVEKLEDAIEYGRKLYEILRNIVEQLFDVRKEMKHVISSALFIDGSRVDCEITELYKQYSIAKCNDKYYFVNTRTDNIYKWGEIVANPDKFIKAIYGGLQNIIREYFGISVIDSEKGKKLTAKYGELMKYISELNQLVKTRSK